MFSRKYALKIFVLAIAIIMVISVSAVSAREAAYNFNTKSPSNAALRSLMLPGWGQFFNEQPTKGFIFAGAELIAVGTAFMMYSSANSTYSDYETQRTAALYDDYSSKVDSANMFVYAAAAIWVGNVIDAYLSADSGTSSKSKKSSTLKKNSKKKKKVEVEEEIEEEPAAEEEEINEEENTEEQEEQVKPRKKQKKQVEEEIEEEPAEPEEESIDEEEDDESSLPGRGFYLQAKGLHQLGIAYRYTF
ncbi:MAG: hypothetical protein PHV60_04755 [bacterium]|nr:hypothetical protein [bacterium]